MARLQRILGREKSLIEFRSKCAYDIHDRYYKLSFITVNNQSDLPFCLRNVAIVDMCQIDDVGRTVVKVVDTQFVRDFPKPDLGPKINHIPIRR